MTDTPSQPAGGNSLAQLAAHAANVAGGTAEKISPEDHRDTLRTLDEVYRHVLDEAATHYNEARKVIDEALHRQLGNTAT